ncbi:DUF975 family protein [Bacillus sp. AFS055030]|uniref:DUF975 family protein n=1 Tax=Bacillus sp. AFS055030 TaxID=2033507 RepID=UPI000BFE32D2|nr:DUF975 family protein [Bacillus sp. AFS055030]PGL66760.1 hypothetical protein CN925_20815 [Bacillus sp. AFS055030]
MYLEELRSRARDTLSGNWKKFVGYTIIVLLLTTFVENRLSTYFPNPIENNLTKYISYVIDWNDYLTLIYSLFITAIITIGSTRLYTFATKEDVQPYSLQTIFYYFRNLNLYLNAFLLNFLTYLYSTLWTLLLIVPGIIKSYSYRMAPYIFIEEPHLTPNDAITKSRRMMDGYKWKLFCLDISFIGWIILCILTVGIGFLWLFPYMNASEAHFYHELKNKENDSNISVKGI